MTDDSAKQNLRVDEDWKSRAQAEKEAMQMKAEQERAEEEAPDSASASSGGASFDQRASEEAMPPPTFSMHVLSLSSQAMVMLGQVPNPLSGKTEVNLPLAQHIIDTLAILDTKTKGNLDDEEAKLLDQMLHELRLGFIDAQSRAGAANKDP